MSRLMMPHAPYNRAVTEAPGGLHDPAEYAGDDDSASMVMEAAPASDGTGSATMVMAAAPGRACADGRALPARTAR
ncbi:hypothetical protein ABZX40_04950 [Streptomyces sp. NPDC004610]|uniref:hypothetical protein n=1 Tax=unclassified Streptomyces TaxID=2593676 RepID=UPI00339FE237